MPRIQWLWLVAFVLTACNSGGASVGSQKAGSGVLPASAVEASPSDQTQSIRQIAGDAGADSSSAVPFGSVSPNYDPPANWLPYRADSTFNQRLSNVDNPTRDPNDRQKIQAMFDSALGSNQYQGSIATPESTALASNEGGGGLPYYFAKTSDPLVTINCTASFGTCSLQGKRFYVPAKAAYAQNNDHHMVVVQPSGLELDVWEWGQSFKSGTVQNPPWHNGEQVNIGWGGLADLTHGTGWDSANGGLTAGGSDGLAGTVREPELASGQIRHALTANTFCSPTSDYVYPAVHASNQQNCHGLHLAPNQIVAMGSRLWLDLSDSQIDSLAHFNSAQKTVLRALHEYGAFVNDNSGYDPLSIGVIESQIPGSVYGEDVVGQWGASHLPRWYDWKGLTWYAVLSASDMTNYIEPHLHVLAPCVNVGYPGSRC